MFLRNHSLSKNLTTKLNSFSTQRLTLVTEIISQVSRFANKALSLINYGTKMIASKNFLILKIDSLSLLNNYEYTKLGPNLAQDKIIYIYYVLYLTKYILVTRIKLMIGSLNNFDPELSIQLSKVYSCWQCILNKSLESQVVNHGT